VLKDESFVRILNYFDHEFWDGKTTSTNWNYFGLILDWYFESSVLSNQLCSIFMLKDHLTE
jgi:eukaryotic-like serine/threonine-protein kinase